MLGECELCSGLSQKYDRLHLACEACEIGFINVEANTERNPMRGKAYAAAVGCSQTACAVLRQWLEKLHYKRTYRLRDNQMNRVAGTIPVNSIS